MKFLPAGINTKHLMLCDVLYHRYRKGENDMIDIIYKDLETGNKYIESIESPNIEIYFTKQQFMDYDYTKVANPLNELDKCKCEYRNIPWAIAKHAGKKYENALRHAMEVGDYRSLSKVHEYPYVFGSDIPIEIFYRTNWLLEYDNEDDKPISKMFMDIEVDGIDCIGVPEGGNCPINAVSLVDGETKTSYEFLLNNPDNPQIQEFTDNVDSFIDELHDMFDESYGTFKFEIYMYDDELKMIKDVFSLINMLKRDFMLIWNGFGFDIPYIIDRIKVLGETPENIMCHSDFKRKQCYFKKDLINYKVANKSDCLKISSYTKYIDQMILYAATRKGQTELRSHALNYIARKELNDEKLNYDDTANIKTLPYENYKLFVAYSIKDSLLQYGIETKAGDIDSLYLRSYLNCTDYDKVFKQTVLLKGRVYYEALLQGYVLGNNINVFNGENEQGSFVGALVGNPLLNSETGTKLFGKRNKFIYDNVMDFDYASLYPSIMIAFNIERNTMVGKLIIPDAPIRLYDYIFEGSNDDEEVLESKYDAGRDFLDNFLTGDVLSIGTKWFNLPSFEDLHYKLQKSYYKQVISKEEKHEKKFKKFDPYNKVKKFLNILGED